MSDPLIGQLFDHYQIISQIGEGQLGASYKSFDPNLQREVGIKLIRLPEGRADLAEAVLKQVRQAAALDHPNLVRVDDFGYTTAWVYVVMDYIPGGNLAQLLQDLRAHNQWLPLAEAVGLVRQVALALDYLGRHGAALRGLKAADIMLKPEAYDGLPFRAVLTSFGLAPEALRAANGWQPSPNAPPPAYAYWSPEEAQGQPLGVCSVVYSLGALLYELAVGWQPFPAQTLAEALRLHTNSTPPAPRSRRADLPEALETVILKAIDPDCDRRYPDPAALAQALAEVMPAAQAADRDPAAGAVSLLVPYQRSLGTPGTGAAPVAAIASPNAPEDRTFFRFNGVVVDANLVQTSPDGQVGVYVEVPQFTVVPGQATSAGLVIVNLGPAPQHFSLALSGVPDGWIAPPRPLTSLALAAGESQRVTVTLAPPSTSSSRAGRYSLALHVASQNLPDQAVEAKISLTVAAFSAFKCELSSDNVQAGEPVRVLVHNQGNTSEGFVVNFDDPEDRLVFNPTTINLSVAEGQVGQADFSVRRRTPRPIGDDRVYPFAVRVIDSSGQVQQLTADVITHALIPVWLLLVAVFACCLLTVVPALAYNSLRGDAANTATALAQQTGNAIAQQTISAVGTHLAIVAALSPTVTATATATPTPTGSPTQASPTPSDTPLPATVTLTPAPATPSVSPLPSTPSATPAPATDTTTPVPPSATLLPPSATPQPTPTATFTLAPPPSPTSATPIGGHVLFVSSAAGHPNISTINGDGSGAAPLTSAGVNQNPSWSAAAQRIAFESTRDGNSQIYTMHLDGLSQTRLTNNAAADTSPVWSPDGTHIAFVSTRDGNAEIYVMNADGSGQTRLTNNSAADTSPAWSPDGTRLAFVSERDGNAEIYGMGADGSNQTRLTNDADPESDPAWSTNGAWVAYVRGAGAQAEIYLTTADGAAQLRLTNNSAADTQPRWAPNGGRLAFVSERDGNPEIYSILADGSQPTRLTNNASRDEQPVWSPAGDRIAFASDRDGAPQLYVMNGDGSAQTRLTNDSASDVPSVWLP